MDELDEVLDEDSVEVLLLDEELRDDVLDDTLVEVLLLVADCEELDRLDRLLSVLDDRLLSLCEEVLAEDVLLLESVLVERLDAVDWLDSDIVCELLDVLTLWLLELDDVLLLVLID